MGVLFNCICMDLFMVLLSIVVCVVIYFQISFKYWKRRNVPYIQPKFPFGTMINSFGEDISFGERTKNQYDEAKAKGHKVVGLFVFTKPMLMVLDPEYVKDILTRDFGHFVDRGVYYNEKDDPLSAHLFTLEGTKWRNLRVKLTPTFTSGKLKMAFHLVVACGNKLKELMDGIISKSHPANIKDVAARFTTDIIGSCIFGFDCNTCEESNSEFRTYAKKIFSDSKIANLKGFIGFAAPELARFLRIRRTQKDVEDFFMKIIRSIVEYRETNNVVRKDFMQLLIGLKSSMRTAEGEETDGLTIEELAAQAFVFFNAGYETSSAAMAFCLYELALNRYIQKRLREEVNAVVAKHDGKLTYDCILEMKYMGQVVEETLRKYPPIPVLNRICVKEYHLPGTDLVIEKGTLILIPTLGLQLDAEYYPAPEKFDPDRFSDENKNYIPPFTYLPFGDGPRVCIGNRFGLLQTKVGLAVLLMNYKFSLNEKTISPLRLDPRSFIMSALGDIWLDVQKVD